MDRTDDFDALQSFRGRVLAGGETHHDVIVFLEKGQSPGGQQQAQHLREAAVADVQGNVRKRRQFLGLIRKTETGGLFDFLKHIFQAFGPDVQGDVGFCEVLPVGPFCRQQAGR